MTVFYRDNFIELNQDSTWNNRAFRYGDGLFETMRIMNGELLFFQDHMDRLFAGMQTLKMDIPKLWDTNYFYQLVCALMEQNQITVSGRIRIQVWRDGEGYYAPQHSVPQLFIEIKPIAGKTYEWIHNGLTIDVASQVRKAYDSTSNIKTSSSLTYILAAIEAQEKKLDEVLIENAYGKIADTCTGNIFLVSKGKITTPSLRDAPIAGILRHNLIAMLRHEKQAISEQSITLQDILQADEVFITNTIHGIRPVRQCRDKIYYSGLTKMLFERFQTYLTSEEEEHEVNYLD